MDGGYRRRWTQDEFWFIVDVEHTLDTIKKKIEREVYAALMNQPKVPFTDAGIKSIEDAVKKVIMESNELDLGYQQTVEFDPAQPGDRESRVLRGVTFSVPIHPITITGKIDV